MDKLIETVIAQLKLIGVDKVLTLLLALYGAILSTILAVRDHNKEKRQVVIFLEYLRQAGHYRVVITNVGHRPITLLTITVRIPYVQLDRSEIFTEDPPFPVTLADGENITIPLTSYCSQQITKTRRNIWIIVRDTENKVYGRYQLIMHDERRGITWRG